MIGPVDALCVAQAIYFKIFIAILRTHAIRGFHLDLFIYSLFP